MSIIFAVLFAAVAAPSKVVSPLGQWIGSIQSDGVTMETFMWVTPTHTEFESTASIENYRKKCKIRFASAVKGNQLVILEDVPAIRKQGQTPAGMIACTAGPFRAGLESYGLVRNGVEKLCVKSTGDCMARLY